MSAYLTQVEHDALTVSGELAVLIKAAIGDGPQAENDWREAAALLHALQHMVMAQAAARAYPALYRPLGRTLVPYEERE